MGDSPGKRMAAFRATTNLTQAQLALSLGVSAATVAFIERDERPPSRSFLQKISERYRVSADWLLNGAGEMRPEPIDTSLLGVAMQDFVQVPILSASLSAGPGVVATAEDVIGNLAFRADWLRREGVTPGSASLVRVKGESMEPTLRDGAMVLVDHTASDPAKADIFALRVGDDVLVKRVQRQGDALLISSDNPAYAAKIITGPALADVTVIGRVVWQGYTFRKSDQQVGK